MGEYIKPNLNLPISLHDAVLSNIMIEDDVVTFVMKEGFFVILGEEARQTGKGWVSFSRVDIDFCKVYCTGKDNYRKEWELPDFANNYIDMIPRLEIIDETYGYNQAKYSCTMAHNQEWIDIEIYHLGEMKYHWEL